MLEQECLYADIDGMDPSCLPTRSAGRSANFLLKDSPSGHHFKEPALGRIIVSRKYRGSNLGPELIQNGIQLCRQTYQMRLYPSRRSIRCRHIMSSLDLPL